MQATVRSLGLCQVFMRKPEKASQSEVVVPQPFGVPPTSQNKSCSIVSEVGTRGGRGVDWRRSTLCN